MNDASQTYAHAMIDAFELDASLHEPMRLRERFHALEWLEEWLDEPSDDEPLRIRARSLHARLAEVQARLCEGLRSDISAGNGAASLQRCQPTLVDDSEGYDHLDGLLSDVFAFDEPADSIAPLEPDMVFYQPTPMRHVFDLVKRASITDDDVFVDLGSGLGHVPMLVSILTGARCLGIEREQVYVNGAQRSAKALRLGNVSFVAQDVREADLSSGTVFYLYTPFTGAILGSVLERLRREAQQRPIRVVTFGPCTTVISAERWLQPSDESNTNLIAVFHPVAV
ncbi:hypothetical protein P5Y53_17625 [Dyella jiangningensis]|uniref:hypothetical protein n=1 Tax=Dyella jiangningensis TaxID=1379159 RepID=UPI00240F768F|nr:hypothetical protein [Dyella jiangningensis]MDG2539502.1 hypothetical protein [Dyella jiangningensis]